MKSKEKNYKIYVIILLIILVFVCITKFSIDIYNEKTQINLDTDEIVRIYQEYDIYEQKIENNLKEICIFEENNICTLKTEYENNENYQYYNTTLIHISNLLNSNSVNMITKKLTIIKYEDLKFDRRISNVKEMIKMIGEDTDSIIYDYLNSLNKLITIHAEESYYSKKANNIFNYNGKEIIYNDYRKIIETELEVYKIVHNITKYIETDLND